MHLAAAVILMIINSSELAIFSPSVLERFKISYGAALMMKTVTTMTQPRLTTKMARLGTTSLLSLLKR
jgi:hypothetical protein